MCIMIYRVFLSVIQIKELEKLSNQYENFGEAEKFMYHVSKVDRYESKLECMVYMGNFDEQLNETQPVRINPISCIFLYFCTLSWQQIDAVLSASLSILRSSRLKKMFEVCRGVSYSVRVIINK